MNKERLYKHNGYGFGYDSDFKDGSCLTIVKSKKDTLEVLTQIFGESANAINGILEYQQQELDKYKNIVDDVYEFVEWHYKDNQEYYKNKGIGLNYPECDYILNKLKELRGFENE